MKLIIAILHHEDADPVSNALIAANFRVTQIASVGGFLRRGSTTLMIGLGDTRVQDAFSIIRNVSSPASDPGAKRATLFVLDIDQFEQL